MLLILINLLFGMAIFAIAPDGRSFFESIFTGLGGLISALLLAPLLAFFVQQYLVKWSTRWAGFVLIVLFSAFIGLFLLGIFLTWQGRIYQSIVSVLLLIGTMWGIYRGWRDGLAI
jgi:hypothetical protein